MSDGPPSPRRDGVFGLILGDLRAKARWCYEDDSWSSVVKALLADGTPSMVVYRLMQWSRRWRLIPLELVWNKVNTVFCNCIIGRGAEFGPEFVLVHATGVVINGSVRGGTGVLIEHQVTIGAERRASPVLGDHVFLGAGAKIIGPVTVGDHARVGANAVVVRDVPAHSTVVGIPARVVRRRAPTPAGETAEPDAAPAAGAADIARPSPRPVSSVPDNLTPRPAPGVPPADGPPRAPGTNHSLAQG